MASVSNLTTAPAATGKSVLKTMVAIFKEEADIPRVLGESEAFIAYTLKNRRAIRLICRANNERGAFRLHESPVHDLRFVNFHSNVAASASSSDFYVWVAVFERGGAGHGAGDKAAATEGRLTVKPYFKLADKVIINTFHFFINPANNMPDLLVLYGKTAAVLESSKLISEYSTSMLEAKLSAASRELRQLPQETSLRSMCTTFSGSWLAFTSEATKVMACTLRNTTTPAWSGCEGDEIVQLSFVGSNAAAAGDSAAAPAADSSSALLAVSSKTRVCVWKLTGVAEPALLRIFTFGGIVTMLTSRNAMAIFNDDGKLARVQVRGDDDFDTTVYDMGGAVRPTSVCYHESTRFATVLVDAVKELDLYQLATNTSAPSASSPTSTPAKEATTAAAAPAPRSSTTPFADPSIISTGIPFRPSASSYAAAPVSASASSSAPAGSASPPAKAISSTATNANPITAMAAYNNARSALQNATLPQSLDGLVASAVYQGDEALRRAIDGLLNVVKNVAQILSLTPDQLTRDHQQLISLALEAQMTELQQTASASAAAAAPAVPAAVATNSRHSEAFNSYALAKLLAPVASEIATGVTRGVRDTLRTELDAAVNAAFNSSIRVNQKEVLRRRLEEALQETPRTLGENAAKWIDAYVERELSESLARMNASMSALEEENRKLQAALTQIVNSGAVQEVEAMRAELAELRAAIRSGEAIGNNGAAAGAGAAATPSPQTVIETAEKYIKEGRISQGLSYVVMAQNARCCVQLLDRLSEDDVARVVSDAETTEATWVKLITQMCEQEATETADELEKVASFLFDVLSEHDEVIAKKTAKAQQVRSDVRHLIARARGKIESSDVRRMLKDLEKSIQ
ncbi:tc40 antigen-like [Leishmania donovani]|uniref:Tc40_antigen-like/GeneDB:LmjF.14.0930 n=1 Tax=Leishmania donovani TaxID=5661 RepID=A0A6J8F6F0_LEIDO|nr:tc40 antigen-like [Leishmania donovani]VDZ43255.1 tc40_antigen-like/GeneDB:LmjF.14.0930 [Leishmania donovani]